MTGTERTAEPGRAGSPGSVSRVRRFLAARLDRESRFGLWLTVGIATFVAAVWAFGGLLEEVLDQERLVHLDMAVNQWLRLHATRAGLATFAVVTQLGSPVVIALVVVVALVLWRRGERVLFWTWLGANVGGKIMEAALKLLVHRDRPEYAAAYLHGQSYSFPSGHSMGAMICYVMLVHVAVRTSERWARLRTPLYAAAGLVIALVGFSRLYLGVHYPSDVLGGYVAGVAWIALSLTAARVARGDPVA